MDVAHATWKVAAFAVAANRRATFYATRRHRWPVYASFYRQALSCSGYESTGLSRVAARLPRDRRRRPAQPGSDLPDALARVPQVGDLDPLVLRQELGTDLPRRTRVQRRHEPGHLAVPVGLVAGRLPVSRRPRHPGLVGCGPDAPAVLPQLQEPLTLGRQRTPLRPLLNSTRRQHNPHNLGKVLRPWLETTPASWPHFRAAPTGEVPWGSHLRRRPW
jgi:hypothetical protein